MEINFKEVLIMKTTKIFILMMLMVFAVFFTACKKEEKDEIKGNILLKTKYGKEEKYELSIKGWIGTYETTRDRKLDMLEFQDNFLSLYSNG